MATVFTMTARMCTIAAVCVALLGVLLFLIGMQVGQRLDARVTVPADHAAAGDGATVPAAAVATPAGMGAGER
ncbi:hypothetical protein OVY01_14290 [Robbsia sp. Bb-Pol-6]|uniref:Uncharacterized protein n=1 Tax=Robbsia betulipollinis TaxID=2981849 RepID=A0ABT3ZPB2_9BURK|nr:hypothetical protein [Robbsia betulipollinis]MCY0388384.1 hypothetical protein [Robbsia betulipollinis]